MVTKFPNTLSDLKRRREHVPASELHFFKIIDALPDEWFVWHSIRWANDTETQSGEADFLIFHPEYGFLVCEVKGGIIFLKHNIFYSENTRTGEIIKLEKSPFEQAHNSMWKIVEFYESMAKKDAHPKELLRKYYGKKLHFPLSFSYFVFFPDTDFKNHHRTIQFDPYRIFDISDVDNQKEWEKTNKNIPSPLEEFLIELLNKYKSKRKVKPRVKDFFLEMIGSDMSRILNLRNYYSIREQELERVNLVQDFLLNALAEKNRCIFKGSAGSGKTYIAMKKAIRNYYNNIKTLFLCFNRELRDSIKDYLSLKLEKPYKEIKGKIDVYSINQYLYHIIDSISDSYSRDYLFERL
jgi:hypothetical protein